MVFRWSLSDSKSSQVSRALLNILADLNHAVVWMVSARPPISNSFSLLAKYLGIVPSASITIDITVIFMFHSFLVLFSLSLNLTLWCARMAMSTIRQVIFFCQLTLDLVFWLGLGNLFVSQNTREICASHYPGRILVCAYPICSYDQISISCTIPRGSFS